MVHDLARRLPLEHRLNLLIQRDRGRMLGAVPVDSEQPSRLRRALRPCDVWRYRLRLVRQPGFRRHGHPVDAARSRAIKRRGVDAIEHRMSVNTRT